MAWVIDVIVRGRLSWQMNSHDVSLAVMEIVDEVRRQIGIRYPADDRPMVEMCLEAARPAFRV